LQNTGMILYQTDFIPYGRS